MSTTRRDPFLEAVLHGPPTPTSGSAAVRRTGGFDGGARTPIPLKPTDPARAHDLLLAELVRTRGADVGRHL